MADYKGDFDKALEELVNTRERIANADSLSIIGSLERKAQQNMLAIQHYSMRLAYWIKETAEKRRQELRSAPVVLDDVHSDRIGVLRETEKGETKRKAVKKSSKAKSSAKKSASEN